MRKWNQKIDAEARCREARDLFLRLSEEQRAEILKQMKSLQPKKTK